MKRDDESEGKSRLIIVFFVLFYVIVSVSLLLHVKRICEGRGRGGGKVALVLS